MATFGIIVLALVTVCACFLLIGLILAGGGDGHNLDKAPDMPRGETTTITPERALELANLYSGKGDSDEVADALRLLSCILKRGDELVKQHGKVDENGRMSYCGSCICGTVRHVFNG